MDDPARKPISTLFLTALGLMLAFMALKRIPALSTEVLGFSVSKLLKISLGLLFIAIGFILYRRHTKHP